MLTRHSRTVSLPMDFANKIGNKGNTPQSPPKWRVRDRMASSPTYLIGGISRKLTFCEYSSIRDKAKCDRIIDEIKKVTTKLKNSSFVVQNNHKLIKDPSQRFAVFNLQQIKNKASRDLREINRKSKFHRKPTNSDSFILYHSRNEVLIPVINFKWQASKSTKRPRAPYLINKIVNGMHLLAKPRNTNSLSSSLVIS